MASPHRSPRRRCRRPRLGNDQAAEFCSTLPRPTSWTFPLSSSSSSSLGLPGVSGPTFPLDFLQFGLLGLLIAGVAVLVLAATHGPRGPPHSAPALGATHSSPPGSHPAFVTSDILPSQLRKQPPFFHFSHHKRLKVMVGVVLFIYKVSTGSSGAGGARPLLSPSGWQRPWGQLEIRKLPLGSCLQRGPKFICLCVFWGHLVGLLRLLGLILVSGEKLRNQGPSNTPQGGRSWLTNSPSRYHCFYVLLWEAIPIHVPVILGGNPVRTVPINIPHKN